MVPFQVADERIPATWAERTAALRLPPGSGGVLDGSNSSEQPRIVSRPTQTACADGSAADES
ncbi:hypothetical protein GCM10009087_12120 [Sphingomonas oligophenolica]